MAGWNLSMRSIPDREVVAALFVLATIIAPPAEAGEMPKDFVYLRDIDPTIQQDMRYAGSENFTGHPVPGYDAPECVLVKPAAEALKRVQAEVSAKGYTLRVYDCYRPARAVAAFVAWAKTPDDPQAKATYYPSLNKADLFPKYIATRSSHSRGATVDLTLVPLRAMSDVPTHQSNDSAPCTAPQESNAPDGSLAMGTTFDCFDGKSTKFASNITAEQNRNRIMLDDVMRAHGFGDYAMEWWHFTLEPEPYPDTTFDFPIEPRQ
jgi:zinc D-Ala-D-Ala dipeptidase